jgi:hypothetical protein
MTLYKEKNLDPVVQRVETKSGVHYNQCKAIVTLDISDGNGGRKDLVVEYPLQGDNHLCMLMKDKETRRDINHDEKFPIASAILDKIERS